jgi:hypothetical protein
VQVTASGPDAIAIVIRLNQDGYTPPPLPKRSDRTWTRDELGNLDPAAADAYISAEEWSAGIHALIPQLGGLLGAAVATGILEQGILTDEYDTSALTSLNMLDASHAVWALANNLPSLDVQAQLASLQKDREDLASVVQSDQGDLKELLSEGQHVNHVLLAKMQAKLAADQAKLKQLDAQIAALSNAVPPGVLLNNNQPYPVYGWLEVGYMAPQVHA